MGVSLPQHLKDRRKPEEFKIGVLDLVANPVIMNIMITN